MYRWLLIIDQGSLKGLKRFYWWWTCVAGWSLLWINWIYWETWRTSQDSHSGTILQYLEYCSRWTAKATAVIFCLLSQEGRPAWTLSKVSIWFSVRSGEHNNVPVMSSDLSYGLSAVRRSVWRRGSSPPLAVQETRGKVLHSTVSLPYEDTIRSNPVQVSGLIRSYNKDRQYRTVCLVLVVCFFSPAGQGSVGLNFSRSATLTDPGWPMFSSLWL